MTRIHPQALVDPGAVVGAGVEIAAFAVVHAGVTLGEGCRVHSFVSLGGAPQHVKDSGEGTTLEIGPRCVLREGATLNRGTKIGTGRTRVGPDCYFMSDSHAGHDCDIGAGVTLTNGALLAGHCAVGDYALLGGQCGVHQFARIGTMAMVAGGSGVSQDVPPYCIAAGYRARLVGLNAVGVSRRGVPAATVDALWDAYRILFRLPMKREAAIEKVRAEFAGVLEVARLVDFVATPSKRGICRHGRE